MQHQIEIGQTTEAGDKAVRAFTEEYPDGDSVGQFYNGISAEGYDEWARRVNFNEPYYIVDEVARLLC